MIDVCMTKGLMMLTYIVTPLLIARQQHVSSTSISQETVAGLQILVVGNAAARGTHPLPQQLLRPRQLLRDGWTDNLRH